MGGNCISYGWIGRAWVTSVHSPDLHLLDAFLPVAVDVPVGLHSVASFLYELPVAKRKPDLDHHHSDHPEGNYQQHQQQQLHHLEQ